MESAVVVYLRTIYYPQGFAFPLVLIILTGVVQKNIPGVAGVRYGRKGAGWIDPTTRWPGVERWSGN